MLTQHAVRRRWLWICPMIPMTPVTRMRRESLRLVLELSVAIAKALAKESATAKRTMSRALEPASVAINVQTPGTGVTNACALRRVHRVFLSTQRRAFGLGMKV
jgi:hypothetical protein